MNVLILLRCIIVCSLALFFTIPGASFADDSISSSTTTAQEPRPAGTVRTGTQVEFDRAYFSGYIADFKHILTSPARWDSSDWLTATLVSGAAIGLYDNDAKIQKWVLDHKTTTTNNIGDNVTYLGHGKFTPVVLGGMYLYGHLTDDGKMKSTVLLSVESFILTGAFTQTLKYAGHRHRPYAEDGSREWDGPKFGGNGSYMSFPSGHASSAFAVATVIASEYDNVVVPVLAYGVAAITAMNRVTHNAHWTSDVFVGSTIGYVTGKAVVASHQGVKENRLSLVPLVEGKDLGAVLVYKF